MPSSPLSIFWLCAIVFLFARRHEPVPLRGDLHCTNAADAQPPAVRLERRNEWKIGACMCVRKGGVCVNVCARGIRAHLRHKKGEKALCLRLGKSATVKGNKKKKHRVRYWCLQIRFFAVAKSRV